MQIQLKQVEIIDALKQYITKQGINLSGKEVTISFTAGRKDSGLSADLNIEDTDIPGVEVAETEAVKPTLSVVPPAPAPVPDEPPFDGGTKIEEPAPAPAAKATTTSLFS